MGILETEAAEEQDPVFESGGEVTPHHRLPIGLNATLAVSIAGRAEGIRVTSGNFGLECLRTGERALKKVQAAFGAAWLATMGAPSN